MGEKKERKKKENNCVIVRHSTVHELNLCFLVRDKHSLMRDYNYTGTSIYSTCN